MTTCEAPAAPPIGLWSNGNATVALGGTALVTLGAYADRATNTVLPRVADDLHGLAWFGAAAAAPMITYVAATAWAGIRVDRRGPAGGIVLGAVVFVLAQLVSAISPDMAVFTGTRLLSGASEAVLDISSRCWWLNCSQRNYAPRSLLPSPSRGLRHRSSVPSSPVDSPTGSAGGGPSCSRDC